MVSHSSDPAFDKYLDKTVREVEKALGGGGMVILIPPGSAKDKVVGKLANIISPDGLLLYKELHERIRVGRLLRVENGQFVVEEGGKVVPLLEYLKGGVVLGSALKQRKVVIVPRDTTEAVTIYALLLKALKEEKKGRVDGDMGELVKVLFLPALYQEGDEEVAELARVDYGHVLKDVVEEAEGVSPSLARLAKEYKAGGRLDELRRDMELLRSLYAGRAAPGLLSIAKEAAANAAKSTGLSWASSVATNAALSHVLTALALPQPLGALASQLLSGLLEGILDRALSRLKKRKDEVFAAIVELAKRAREAEHLVEKAVRGAAGLEALVDWVAASWGLTIREFATVVHNLAALLEGKLATHGDVEKAVEELRRELEARWTELERRVERLEEWKKTQEVRGLVEAGLAKVYLAPEDWAGVLDEKDGVLKLRRGLLVGEGVELVETKLVDAVVEEVMGGGRMVVVRGRKGIGKTTAVAVALYRLSKGVVDGLVPAVVELYLAPGVEAYLYQLPSVVERANEAGVFPIFYLDPSKALAYEWATAGEHRPEPLGTFVKALAELSKAPRLGKAAVVVVVSNDQYEVVRQNLEGVVREVDADEIFRSNEGKMAFVKALVKKYSGCPDDAVEKASKDVVLHFVDNYAVAAVLAADWLKRHTCNVEEVEKAVEKAKGDVHRLALHYLWHGLFNGNDAVASQYAPLLLAVGFFGPHPPKLAKAVVRAFGGRPEYDVLQLVSQPLHGSLYETIRKIAHGAVYRRFGVGGDELYQGSVEGPCRLVEICSEALVGVPLRSYSGVAEVAEEYAKLVAKALKAPGPAGVRQIDFIIDNFLRVFNGVAEDGRWRIKYEVEGPKGVKTIEYVVDELDVLSALYGLAALPGWRPELNPLEDWLFVSGEKAEVVRRYLYPILREWGRELAMRAVAIFHEARRRSDYVDVDFWRAVGIAAAGHWVDATDEELEKAVRLIADTLNKFTTYSPHVLRIADSLLSEAWRRVERGEASNRLADQLALIAYYVVDESPQSLRHFFSLERREVATRFNALYNAASNAGKYLLLDLLLNIIRSDIVLDISGGEKISALLLGKPQIKPREAFREATQLVEEFVSSLQGVERAYVAASLYMRRALRHSLFGEIDKAKKFAEEALNALKELEETSARDRTSVEEALQPYLELRWVRPDLERGLNDLRRNVYHHAVFVYMDVGDFKSAENYAEKACEIAKKLGSVYFKIASRSLSPRLKAVKDGVPPVEEFESLWHKALESYNEHKKGVIVDRLGEYVVALASAPHLNNSFDVVEKVLEKWGWALELRPVTRALTYGVLSLFNERYLDKLAAVERLVHNYGEDVAKALNELSSSLISLFLSILVGLAHCKRGEKWGLDLAKAAARAGSTYKGIYGRIFDELYKALENVPVTNTPESMGNCVTDMVLKAVYKFYYRYV